MSVDGQITQLRRRMRHRVRWQRFALLSVSVFLLFAIISWASMYSFFRALSTKLTGPYADAVPVPVPGQRINILVMGLDKPNDDLKGSVDIRDTVSRSDTMILVSIDPETKDVSLLSIPRDSRVNIPGIGMDKINAAHAYGGSKGGPALAMKTVRDFLGVDVHYYVRTNVQGFARIVDLLGGVEMDIPEDMVYKDPTQDLEINLKKGKQWLNGEKAMEFVRYRQYVDGDIGRIKAQQDFIQAVIKRAFNFGIVFKLPSLYSELVKLIDTNMDAGTMMNLATMAARFNSDKVQMATIPGTDQYIDEISYWIPDQAKTREVVDRLIRGIDRQANAQVKVEVLNGTGVTGLSAKLAGRLRDLGYNVVNVGNADRTDYAYTKIINRNGDDDNLRRLVRTMVRWAPQAKPFDVKEQSQSGATVTIIIGKDFK